MKFDGVLQIRSIKRLRRDRADGERRVAKVRLDQSLAEVAKAEAELDEWRRERPRREQALYDGVMNRAVEQRELDEVRHAVLALRDHERTLDDARRKKEDAAAAARKALAAAVAAAAAAQRALDGFDDLVEILERRDRAEREGREDLELEEFGAARDDGDDEGGFADDESAVG